MQGGNPFQGGFQGFPGGFPFNAFQQGGKGGGQRTFTFRFG